MASFLKKFVFSIFSLIMFGLIGQITAAAADDIPNANPRPDARRQYGAVNIGDVRLGVGPGRDKNKDKNKNKGGGVLPNQR